MDTKKIFVLGNGFDLAHYLPTAYVHFMDAMRMVEGSEENAELGFDNLFHKYISGDCSEIDKEFFQKTKKLYKTDDLQLSPDKVKELRGNLKSNGWFQHFKHHLTDVDTWIDFENEIQKLLISVCDLFDFEFNENTVGYWDINESKYSSSLDADHCLKMSARKVLFENERQINENFLRNLRLKEGYFSNTLRYFDILQNLYVIATQECDDLGRHREVKYERVSKQEYSSLQESVSSYPKRLVKDRYERVVDTKLLRKYSGQYLGLDEPKILKILLNHLNEFNDIFKLYIEQIVNRLEPKSKFARFGDLNENLEAVFTFNYSSSFERLYPDIELLSINNVQYVHGNTDSRKIVLGISDLEDERLRGYKVYGFVKTHQKLLNSTDYQFLDHEDLNINSIKGESLSETSYEVIVWGHSLADSDAEYIRAIFALNKNERSPNCRLRVMCYEGDAHEPLANLIHIVTKGVIEQWMKKGWLVFETAPDIYKENGY
ncbi:AbiH family protein [Psychrobacter piscatorii]|uniref:Bacteriophage abortive infection AbiH n=1 Tax=Psychrobacter piscatorii TaxID=554343 RepID=A0A0T6DRI6_9GAMM|nr:AbiH family protein [Psychrobacter piscatorii]KRU22125.1 hypothetical protein AS194_09725 [Psychrobacter piscatorii]